MKFTIHPQTEGSTLRIEASDRERAEMQERAEDFDDWGAIDSSDYLSELLHEATTEYGDSLELLCDGETSDMTSAPMLGILGDEEKVELPPRGERIDGFRLCGCYDDPFGVTCNWGRPILKRWAFMRYQITSIARDLVDYGYVVMEGGNYITRPAHVDTSVLTGAGPTA